MEAWGCEFLDSGEIQPFYEFEKENIYQIPMDFLDLIVDPNYINNIMKKDGSYIDDLVVDINRYGVLYPGLVVVAPNGLLLKDGNHRYCASKRLGLSTFPIAIRIADGRIKAWSGSYQDIIMKILETL